MGNNLQIFVLSVSQLRGHWEETSSKVMARRNQLEDLLVDNQQFETKRHEVEAWLGRMEAWLSRMRPVGTTADVLEAQIREQKVSSNFILILKFMLNLELGTSVQTPISTMYNCFIVWTLD